MERFKQIVEDKLEVVVLLSKGFLLLREVGVGNLEKINHQNGLISTKKAFRQEAIHCTWK